MSGIDSINPFLGEIRIMSFNFAPAGWAMCNGQLLPINQNQALFSLLGTRFGGDGRVNFALPDLRGRVPIHAGAFHTLGEAGGEEAHTLTTSEMPQHFHVSSASAQNGDTPVPTNDVLGLALNAYRAADNLVALNPQTVTNIGGFQPHSNMQPYLTLTFAIALQGIFPSAS